MKELDDITGAIVDAALKEIYHRIETALSFEVMAK